MSHRATASDRCALACGVDEAGRGPLAGPVYAAAVILDRGRRIAGLADSKVLSPQQREELALEIRSRAIEQLAMTPDRVLVDGVHRPQVALPVRAVVDGDAKIKAISAASILAKVSRDAEMVALHRLHPQYGFDRHKGYSTAEHLSALRVHGVSIVHRRTFEPVRVLLAKADS